jgi:predicted choloylglycine hydrolase
MNNINRRDFLKKGLYSSTAVLFKPVLTQIQQKPAKLYPGGKNVFPLLKVKGSYYDLGFAMGKNFGKDWKKILNKRKNWFEPLKNYVKTDGKKYFEELLSIGREQFPKIIEELQGMAEGANMSFEDIFLVNVKSEIGSRLSKANRGSTGCSTIYLVNKDRKMLFHNEDGHSVFYDHMFMIYATPPYGVTYLALVYPLHLPGNGPGFNDFGISQTTNFIACEESRSGVPRYFLNRAVLETKTIDEAVKTVTYPNRAFAYHHNIGSFKENRLLSVEVTPDNYDIFEPDSIYFHTNHLILDKTRNTPQDEEYLRSSSHVRYKVIEENINKYEKEGELTDKNMLNILSSHERRPFSPCRHPEGNIKGKTLAASVMDLKDSSMTIYKGNPCKAVEKDGFTLYKFN